MPLTLLPKPSLDQFIRTCTPLAVIDALEEEFEDRVTEIAEAMFNYNASDNPVENLALFLKADQDFLGIILALTNLSQEKFLRILSAERFAHDDFDPEWTTTKIWGKLRTEAGFAERIASLFIEGSDNSLLAEQVATFYLNQLSLPNDWSEIIRDHDRVIKAVRQKLNGEYSDRKGDYIELLIRQHLDRIQVSYGITHTKGQVALVMKEVDHVLPSREQPFIMIMTSYMETTSSSQTTRANEQREMFLAIQNDNLRYSTRRIFINFVDGGGWLARRSDLKKMHGACDYIINLKTLNQMEAIICKYVPDQFFTQPRPQVEG